MPNRHIERDDHYLYFLADTWYKGAKVVDIPNAKIAWINSVFAELDEVQNYLKELEKKEQ